MTLWSCVPEKPYHFRHWKNISGKKKKNKIKRIFIGWPVYHGNKIKRSITNFNSEITQNNTKTKIPTLEEYIQKENAKTGKVIRDKNDKSTKLTDNFKQNCRLTEISKTVRIITSS